MDAGGLSSSATGSRDEGTSDDTDRLGEVVPMASESSQMLPQLAVNRITLGMKLVAMAPTDWEMVVVPMVFKSSLMPPQLVVNRITKFWKGGLAYPNLQELIQCEILHHSSFCKHSCQ